MSKRLGLVAILALVLLLLTACGGPEGTYKNAQDLLSKGKYTEAAEKFESLGSYEDATTLTMYCKACALCEAGNYETGIAAFKALGSFKDCVMRITYYNARAYEDYAGTDYWEYMLEAKALYKTVPVFLDSAERMTALDNRIEAAKSTHYNASVASGDRGNYYDAVSGFKRLGNYKDSKNRATYYSIRADEAALAASADQDAVIAVSSRYSEMGAYLDCADRTTAMTAKADEIVANKYDKVAALANEGKYAEAETALASFGKYGNGQVKANYYTVADKYLAQGQWDAAAAAFKKAGDYSNATDRISEAYFMQAEEIMNNGEYDKAIKAFKKLDGYGASTTMIKECNYRKANKLLQNAQYPEAYALFAELKDYNDVSQIVSSNPHMVYERKMTQYAKWEVISFGQYAGRDIRWSVLSNDGDKILLACKYVLDVIPEHSGGAIKNWVSSLQRAWLNGAFYNNSFSAEEKQCVLPTALDGGKTVDNVFVLSRSEAYYYYSAFAGGKGSGYRLDIGVTSLAQSKGAQETNEIGIVWPDYYYYPTRDGYYSNHDGDKVDYIKGDSYLIPCIYVSLDEMP